MLLDQEHPYSNYYLINNNRYETKLFALLADKSLDFSVHTEWQLPCFDSEFDKLDLLTEPTESLEQCYLSRAQSLRNEYDHIILHYSGGHDSHNILETFMLNGIFIDEILILETFDRSYRYSLEQKNFEFLHQNAYEAERSAIPLARYFIETYSPHTKLTIVDNSFSIHSKYWLNLSTKDMVKNLLLPGTLGMIGKTPLRLKDLNCYNTSWKTLKENKKVAHVWGRDKVCLRFDKKGYFFMFSDSSLVDFINPRNNLTVDECAQDIEFFYTHPSMAKAILKQAHMVMKHLPFYKVNPGPITRSYENDLAKILYNRKINSGYQGLKAGDFENWAKYLNKRRAPFQDLTQFNMAELSLLKSLDSSFSQQFEMQAKIIGEFLKTNHIDVENLISRSYSSKRYYVKYFE